MTQINLSKIQFFSGFSDFGNPTTQPLAFAVPATTVSAGNAKYTYTTPLINTNGLTSQEFQMTGLDSNWYQLGGFFITYYNNSNALTSSDLAYYVVEIDGGFAGSNFLVVVSLFLGSAGVGTVTTPAFTMNFNLSLFSTPF